MTHQRQVIREAARGMLLGKGPWLEVYTNRMRPLSARPNIRSDRSQLPALIIYTRTEKATIHNAAPREYKCTVDMIIEIVAADTDKVDNTLDDMAATVERILGRDDTIAGTADDCVYTGTDMTIVAERVEQPIGGIALVFEVTYYREAPDPESTAELDDLERVHVDYSLNNQQDDPRDRAQTHIEDLEQ